MVCSSQAYLASEGLEVTGFEWNFTVHEVG